MAAALLCVLHFVLIHGACHGSWAWYRLEDQLKKAGHTVSSMDMAGAGINLSDPDAITSWEEYHKPALDFFQSLPERAATMPNPGRKRLKKVTKGGGASRGQRPPTKKAGGNEPELLLAARTVQGAERGRVEVFLTSVKRRGTTGDDAKVLTTTTYPREAGFH